MYKIVFIFCFSIIIIHATEIEKKIGDNDLSGLIPLGYDKYKAPSHDKNAKLSVDLILLPFGIRSLSMMTMDFSFEALIDVTWIDTRFDSNNIPAKNIECPKNMKSKLWFPKITPQGCKDCATYLLDPEKHNCFFNSSSKRILIRMRQVFTFFCKFELSNYPFDIQTCRGIFAYIEDLEEISIKFSFAPDYAIENIRVPPGYTLNNVIFSHCTTDIDGNEAVCTSIIFFVRRIRIRSILLIFFPSILLVVISWFSFWMDARASAARITLGLTVVLALGTLFDAAQTELPMVSTMMALDVWTFVCVLSVFASLIEYAFVNFFDRFPFAQLFVINCNPTISRFLNEYLDAKKIDVLSRILFPVVFFSFNLFFWIYYCKS